MIWQKIGEELIEAGLGVTGSWVGPLLVFIGLAVLPLEKKRK